MTINSGSLSAQDVETLIAALEEYKGNSSKFDDLMAKLQQPPAPAPRIGPRAARRLPRITGPFARLEHTHKASGIAKITTATTGKWKSRTGLRSLMNQSRRGGN